MGNQLGSSLATIYERHRTGFTLASIAVDGVLLWVAFWAAWLLRYRFDIGGQVLPWDLQPFSAFHGRAALFVGLALIVLVIRGVYRQLHWPSIIDETVMLVGSLTVAMGGVVLANYLSRFSPSRLVFIYAWFIAIVLLVLTRIVRRSVLHSLWRRSIGIERVLVIGSGEIGRRVCQAIMGSPNSRLRVAGFVSESGRREAFTVGTEDGIRFAPSLGLLGDLPRLLERGGVDHVILALPAEAYDAVVEVSGLCRAAQIPVMVVPDPLHMSMERVEIAEIDGLPLLRARIPVIAGIDGSVKRAFDLVVAMIALIVFAFPIMLIALRLRLESDDAVFSRSVRVGRNGTLFDELSFRSIGESSETSSLSLDFSGLPRIFNLLRGDLSIVGPLAQKPESVAQYEEWHRARLMATPGVTGLWRTRASEEMTFAEMVLLDLFYAEHWSIWLDLRIVMRSIGHLAGSPAGQQTVYRDAPATSPQ